MLCRQKFKLTPKEKVLKATFALIHFSFVALWLLLCETNVTDILSMYSGTPPNVHLDSTATLFGPALYFTSHYIKLQKLETFSKIHGILLPMKRST